MPATDSSPQLSSSPAHMQQQQTWAALPSPNTGGRALHSCQLINTLVCLSFISCLFFVGLFCCCFVCLLFILSFCFHNLFVVCFHYLFLLLLLLLVVVMTNFHSFLFEFSLVFFIIHQNMLLPPFEMLFCNIAISSWRSSRKRIKDLQGHSFFFSAHFRS